MKNHLLALILLATAVTPAEARKAKPLDPTMVPVADATLRALSAVIETSQTRQAELSRRVAALQAQIAAIKAKAKDPKVEVGEQLSKEDLDSFNLLNTQLRYLQAAVTVEQFRQSNLKIAKDIYRASYFTATMMTEYIGDKGALDDDFDDFCRARAAAYGMDLPVGMLLTVQDYIMDATPEKKK
jgi:hypothetical protein